MINQYKEKFVYLIFVFFVLIMHLALINFSSINFEFAFADGAKYFIENNNNFLDQYFFYQANPLGLPYITSLFSRLLPNIDILVLIRLLNIFGIVLLSYSILILTKQFNSPKFITLCLILFNPIIWTFSGRATADFLPMTIGIFAITLTLRNDSIYLLIIASIIFATATVLKYHALSLIFFLIAIHFSIRPYKHSILKIFYFTILVFLLLAVYNILVNFHFGFWVVPQNFLAVHKFNFSNVFNNFILYFGFLLLLCYPLFWFTNGYFRIICTEWKLSAFFILLIYLIYEYGFIDTGEMNFGPLDKFIPSNFRVFFVAILSFFSLPFIYNLINLSNFRKLNLYTGLAIIFILFVYSISRPAQRYLIFVIPFFVLFLPLEIIKSRLIIFSTIIIFTLTNAYIEISRYTNSSAAQNIVNILENLNLLKICHPGAIEGHQGNRFFIYRNYIKKYQVVSGDKLKNKDAIISTSSSFFIFKSSYSVIAFD